MLKIKVWTWKGNETNGSRKKKRKWTPKKKGPTVFKGRRKNKKRRGEMMKVRKEKEQRNEWTVGGKRRDALGLKVFSYFYHL